MSEAKEKSDLVPHLTRVQAAALVGIPVQHFYQVEKQDGTIKRTERKRGRGEGTYPTREFGLWLRQYFLRDMGVTDDGERYDDKLEKGRLLHHQANNEEIKVKVAKGELIPADEVLKKWTQMIGAMKAKLLGLPTRLAARSMGFETQLEAEQYIKEEIYTALRELGDENEN